MRSLNKTRSFYPVALFVTMLFASCSDTNRLYERNVDIPDAAWSVNNTPGFKFQIDDTTALYNVLVNVRNEVGYPFYNLYMRFTLSDTLGKPIHKVLKEYYLFNPQSGVPSGEKDFMTGLYDRRYPALNRYKFTRKGTYVVTLEQYMRNQDPLNGIISVGVRLEKAK